MSVPSDPTAPADKSSTVGASLDPAIDGHPHQPTQPVTADQLMTAYRQALTRGQITSSAPLSPLKQHFSAPVAPQSPNSIAATCNRTATPGKSPATEALQALYDDDLLGTGFWPARALSPHIQYLCLGDTSHATSSIRNWLYNEASYLDPLSKAGFTDMVIEVSAGLAPVLNDRDRLQTDSPEALKAALRTLEPKASDTYLDDLVSLGKKSAALGITLHCLDQQLDGPSPSLRSRVQHEGGLADQISAATGDRRTIIVYGASHFAYTDSLADHLGRDRCHVTNIHESAYEARTSLPINYLSNVTYQPDSLHLINQHDPQTLRRNPELAAMTEPVTVRPYARYGRAISADGDLYLETIMTLRQEKILAQVEAEIARDIQTRALRHADGTIPEAHRLTRQAATDFASHSLIKAALQNDDWISPLPAPRENATGGAALRPVAPAC